MITDELVRDGLLPSPQLSLEELISVCGEDFRSLVRYRSDLWCARSPGQTFAAEGPTPREAVAGLWRKISLERILRNL
jgi:hypothetical protein